ncbi:MAG: Ig-like domain-containing protein [Rhodoferax sp.]
MSFPKLVDCILLGFMCLPVLGHADESRCHVDYSRGATSREGATFSMRVINDGGGCKFHVLGDPNGGHVKQNEATGGTISQTPAHGTAEVVEGGAEYKPTAGYVGDDEFAYKAFISSTSNGGSKQVLVHVKVSVLAP